MNWTKYVWISGALCLNQAVAPAVLAQITQQVAPQKGIAVVEGEIQDAQTKTPIAGAIITAKSLGGVVGDRQTTNDRGAFQIRLDPRQSYILTIKATGYITLEEQQTFSSPTVVSQRKKVPIQLFRTPAPGDRKPVAANSVSSAVSEAPQTTGQAIAATAPAADNGRVVPPKTLDAKVIYTPPLVVAPVGKATQLQALQFVQSQAELLPNAQPALDQLLAFMNDHPTVEIELAGHTDNQGDFDKNIQLSKQRVDVVKDYLVKNGIAAGRITTRGYGPTRPIASNNRETTRQLNRRVEMTVVKQ